MKRKRGIFTLKVVPDVQDTLLDTSTEIGRYLLTTGRLDRMASDAAD